MDVLAPIRRFDRFQQRHTLLAVPMATIKKYSDDQASNLVVAIAYYSFFSVFPLLLVFMTILGYLLAGDPSFEASVKHSVLGDFPVIGTTLQHSHLKGHALALVAGVLLSLWSGSGVTGTMASALEQVWEIPRPERANFFKKKIRGLLLLLILGVLFVVGSGASGVMTSGLGSGIALTLAGIVVSMLVNFCLFMAAFHFLCAEPPGWRELLPGSVVAAIFWTGLQLGGGAYIDHIKHSDNAYGTFALVLGILTWLHLGIQLTMYSAEFNTVLAGKRWPRALLSGDEINERSRANAEKAMAVQRGNIPGPHERSDGHPVTYSEPQAKADAEQQPDAGAEQQPDAGAEQRPSGAAGSSGS